MGQGRTNPQIFCAITRTNARTHETIRANLHRSPLFTGASDARGPRYCPSIEDKIHRFADRDSHQIFLEPEGLGTHLVYPNGISTSLPTDVQLAMVRTMEGLEQVGLMPATDASLLREAYKAFRAVAHRQALQKEAGVVTGDQFVVERQHVRRIWSELGLS